MATNRRRGKGCSVPNGSFKTSAVELFNKSVEVTKTDPQWGYKLLISALQEDAALYPAWNNLACFQADNRMIHAAIACWKRLLQAPDVPAKNRADVLGNIGHRLFLLGRLDEAEDWTRQALAVDETLAYPWENLSAIEMQRGNTGLAIEHARRGFGMSREPVTEIQYALALLNDGQFALGLKHFESRFAYRLKEYLHYPYERWQGGTMGRLYVACEQGLGDTISFARFLPFIRQRTLDMVFAVQPELMRLLAYALPDVVFVQSVQSGGTFPTADAWCPLMSLPVMLGWDDKRIAECPDLDYGLVLQQSPGRSLRVGLSWGGAPANDKDQFRSVPFHLLMDLFTIPGIEWLSLQTGERALDVHSMGAEALIRDLSATLRDACITAELIAGDLDLVITVDSFVGHLAGVLGRETWVMTAANAGDWRLGRRGERAALWYNKHRIFRQDADAQWEPVIARVGEALRQRVSAAAEAIAAE
jgi:hypothetical protein